MEAEMWHRSFLGHKIPRTYYEERDAIEEKLLRKVEEETTVNVKELNSYALEREAEFCRKWKNTTFDSCTTSYLFKQNWTKKNRELK